MARIRIPNNWVPRHYQRPLWEYLEQGGKRAVACWHRRAGKDDVDLNWTAAAMIQKPATYWYMLPQANQARRAVWDAVNPHTGVRRLDQAFPAEIREATRDHEMFMRLKNGSTFQVVGSDNYNSLLGSPPYGIVFSEWSLSDPNSWAYLRPILRENNGWALFNYTPRGRNHGWTTLETARSEPGWFHQVLTADDNGVFQPGALEEELRQLVKEHGEDYGDAVFRQEYFCSFDAATPGAYYAKLIEAADRDGRIGRVPWEPTVPVYLAWDLGINDCTVLWFFQINRREIWLIDYHRAAGQGLDYYAKLIRSKPYVYADRSNLWPHDMAKGELGTGKKLVEVAESLGLRGTIVANIPVNDGIGAVRMMMPRCYFDKEKCAEGIDGLRQYHRLYDEERKIFHDKPFHDWTSDIADAFRYLAVGLPDGQSLAGFKKLELPKDHISRNVI